MAAGDVRVLQNSTIWLERTQAWLYDQLTHLPTSIDVHVAAERLRNGAEFPMPNLHALESQGRRRFVTTKALARLGLRRHGHVLDVLRTTRASVLHSHFGSVAWAAVGAAERTGVPHVATFYGFDVTRLPQTRRAWSRRYARLFASVDRVLCEGPHMARSIVALGCSPDKVGLHRLGVDLAELPFRPRSLPVDRPLRVLVAAGFREKKGIPDAIAALDRVARDHPVTLTLVGSGDGTASSRRESERIAAAAQRASYPIARPGILSHAALNAELYRHDVLIAPSVTAADGDTEGGAPMTIIEAAASGMPVVATRHCDIPDVLTGGHHLLAGEHDVAGLAGALARLVSGEDWRPTLTAVRRHVEAEHDARRQSARLGALYTELSER